MMTNRSSHMPTLTNIDTVKTTAMFRRSFFDQSTCGTMKLQRSSIQYDQAYGP